MTAAAARPRLVTRREVVLLVVIAAVVTAGRLVVPLAVQRTIDQGLQGPHSPDLALIRSTAALAITALLASTAAGYLLMSRLARLAEHTLADLRRRAFRHVHDLSAVATDGEQRGALVSRVTSDVDTVSAFVQWGGLTVLVSTGQLVVATIVMAVWSWQLTLVVYAAFAPLAFILRVLQRRLDAAYTRVRTRLGELLGAIAEAVVGAVVVRAFGIERRTGERVDGAVDRMLNAQISAQRLAVIAFSSGELAAALATAAVLAVGVLLGVGGAISIGKLVGFVFLVTLFVQPVQVATEVLNEAQNAAASIRRVRALLATPADIVDPADAGVDIPAGPVAVRFERLSFAYGRGPTVLHELDLTVAPQSHLVIVGETGSGKSTLVRLLVRLMDPTAGRILLSDVPLDTVRFASLRQRVVLVPQEGYLFEGSVADNVRWGEPSADDDAVARCFDDLGLAGWVAQLPAGLATEVGERGAALSFGERQLVALARAHIARPDLLVLDEATSSLDPATEVRVQEALVRLTRGRTTVTIAHRLSTAETADTIVVLDHGRIVEQGSHDELLAVDGIYRRLFAAWKPAAVPVAVPCD